MEKGVLEAIYITAEKGQPVQSLAQVRAVPGRGVVRGVALNRLVNKSFKVGEVRLRGLRLCEPCQYLAKKTQAEVLPGLLHRGGLRAEILSEGTLRVGDVVDGTE